mgnify:CR=1 FL=1
MGLTFIALAFIAFIGKMLANGVSDMSEKHPDYRGEDFLELPNTTIF